MKNVSESHINRVLKLAGILKEADTKADLYSNSSQKTPFNRNLMKQAIQQGREVGLLFQSDNETYKMPVAKYRIIRPVAMGTNSKGNLVFRAVHVIGQSESKARDFDPRRGSAEAQAEWRLFNADNVKGMWFTGNMFNVSPPGFNPNDKEIQNIEVVFNPSRASEEQKQLAQQRHATDSEAQKEKELDQMQQQVDQQRNDQQNQVSQPQQNQTPQNQTQNNEPEDVGDDDERSYAGFDNI